MQVFYFIIYYILLYIFYFKFSEIQIIKIAKNFKIQKFGIF